MHKAFKTEKRKAQECTRHYNKKGLLRVHDPPVASEKMAFTIRQDMGPVRSDDATAKLVKQPRALQLLLQEDRKLY